MRLQNQLALGVSALFLVLFGGLAAIFLKSHFDNLQEQLASQSQDAATAIALRLSALKSLEPPVAETVINPVFDRGYFAEIQVLAADGSVVARKAERRGSQGAPGWFLALFPTRFPGAQALVTNGWQETGRVVAVAHPHFLYRKLWEQSLQTLGWLAVLYLATLAGTVLFLSKVLRPLRDIESAALAISERDFRVIGELPRAPELARTVRAMNGMSGRLREIVEQESARAESLRREAFEDAVTRVFNRRGFHHQFETRLVSRSDVAAGALALVELDGFGEFNARAGYRRGDEFLAEAARRLAAAAAREPQVLLGRMGGATFALAAPNPAQGSVERLLAEICQQVGELCAGQSVSTLRCHAGAVRWEAQVPAFSALLGAADLALQRAREKGANAWHANVFDAALAAGAQAWREEITRALEDNRILAYAQAVFSLPGRALVHREVTARIRRPGGEVLRAGEFLPMAASLGLVAPIDVRIVELALAHLARQPSSERLAVNVSFRTVEDEAQAGRIAALLARSGAAARSLVFEMTEFGALQDRSLAQAFCERLRGLGAGFAIDNFSMQEDSIYLLRALRPEYVKLSPRYTEEIAHSADCRFFLDQLVRLARPMDVAVYAQAVEDESLLALLGEHGVAGYQGFAASEPYPL